jgi:glycosyltransferase involved in cell wall biosynthesis
MDVTIAVATFGDESWAELARDRAIPSAEVQGVPVVHVHGDTLHGARNAALEQVTTEFVIHLDGDDELDPDYVAAMAEGHADVRAPLWQPRVAGHTHDCDRSCLRAGNWIVVGAAARTEIVREVGWHDFPWSEDWATWALCAEAGASFELVPRAIYVAHVRLDSRNRGVTRDARLDAHRAIERFVWPEEHAA